MKQKYCGNCGTETEEGSNFCYQCGSKIGEINPQISSFTTANTNIPDFYKDNTIQVQSPNQKYSNTQYSKIRLQKKSTGTLIIVLIINYLSVMLLGLGGFISLLVIPIIGIIILFIAILYGKLTLEVQRHSNTARLILVILILIGFFIGLTDLDIISLSITVFQLYALLFHKDTVALFQ